MATLITVIHVLACFFLVTVILLQQGKGADAGAAFGGGSNTIFGASGADTLLVKITTVAAAVFMLSSIYLALHANHHAESEGGLFQDLPDKPRATAPAQTSAPVAAPSAQTTSEPSAAAPAPTAAAPVPANPAPAAPVTQ